LLLARAVVVDEAQARGLHLLLGGHRAAAAAAADEPGERELPHLRAGQPRPAEEGLDALELFEGHHGLVLARIAPAVALDDSRIEGFAEDLVEGAERKCLAARALALLRAQAPLVGGDLEDL